MRAALPVLSLLCLGACERAHLGPPENVAPDLVLTQVKLHTYRGGTTSVIATTPQLGFHREGPQAGQVLARDVIIDSRAGLHVEASTVQGDAVGGLLEGFDVHAVSSAGTTFDSPRATFDRNQGESGTASTDAGVLVQHPSFTHEAQSGWADIAAERTELYEVRTRIK